MEELTYAYYPVFRRTPALDGVGRDEALHEWEVLFKEHADPVTVRGWYSAEGLRPDADLLMWWVAGSVDAFQDLVVALRRTALGRGLEDWAWRRQRANSL